MNETWILPSKEELPAHVYESLKLTSDAGGKLKRGLYIRQATQKPAQIHQPTGELPVGSSAGVAD
jgi:hypothetical protein